MPESLRTAFSVVQAYKEVYVLFGRIWVEAVPTQCEIEQQDAELLESMPMGTNWLPGYLHTYIID